MALGINFLTDIDSFWVVKRSQGGSKIVPKIDPGGVLGGVLVGFGGLLGAKTEQCHERSIFGGHLGAVLGASWGRLCAWIAVVGRLGTVWGHLKIDVRID